MFFARPFLNFYLGSRYVLSIPVFIVYNLILFVRVNSHRDILTAASKTKIMLKYDVMVFVLNLVLNYFLIRSFGIMGAVVATLISLFILAILMLTTTLRMFHIRFAAIFDLKLIFTILLLSGLFGFLVWLVFSAYSKIVLLPVYYLFYLAGVYLLLYKRNNAARSMINDMLLHFFKLDLSGK